MGSENAADLTTGAATEVVAYALADAATRPMRADAQRNRRRVLDAALAVFAEEGVDAGMEAIARRANVGVGTVYRHFATKEALIDALAELHFEEMREVLDEALQKPDAWAAMTEIFETCAERNARDRIFAEMNDPREIPAVAPIIEDLLVGWDKLIRRAQKQGALRADFEANDIPAVMCGLANVVMTARSEADWRRYLEIMLAGLRADATTAEAGERSALTAR